MGDEEDFNSERRNTEKGWRRLYKSNNKTNRHHSLFDSVSYGEKISELLYQDQRKDRPFLIYFAPLTKVYPNQRNSFQDIIKERRKKISQLDQAVDLVRAFVRSNDHALCHVCPDQENFGRDWSVREHGDHLHV